METIYRQCSQYPIFLLSFYVQILYIVHFHKKLITERLDPDRPSVKGGIKK